MKSLELGGRYALRILRGEWHKYILPFLSLTLSATVITVVVLLTTSAADYLKATNRAMIGGDVTFEASYRLPAELEKALAALAPFERMNELRFSGTLHSASRASAMSIRAVDETFPLVGELVLQEGLVYAPLAENEILLDAAAAQRLNLRPGESLKLGQATFTLVGIIAAEPDSLLGAMRLYPRAIIAYSGVAYAGLNPGLLRASYRTAIRLPAPPDAGQRAMLAELTQQATAQGFRVKVAHQTEGRSERQLQVVRQFLVVTTLITLLLTVVNVYISTQFMLKRMQHTFTLLQILGIRRRFLSVMLALTLGSLAIMASLGGLGIGRGVTGLLLDQLATRFHLSLPAHLSLQQGALVGVLILAATLVAFLPAWLRSVTLTPRALLTGEPETTSRQQRYLLIGLTALTLVPFWWVTSVALESPVRAALTLAGIFLLYSVIGTGYRLVVTALYRSRPSAHLAVRTLFAQKHYDGLFGTVSFTSLFLALTALSTLSLTHTAVRDFFDADLADSLPTTYLVDVQPNQRDTLNNAFPELVLFPNVRARLLAIDGVRIQEAIAAGDPSVNRELGREYNINYRSELLNHETLVAGDWTASRAGTFSVERNFGERTGIHLGSELELLIQGFTVKGTVTSLRETDQRNGLPFFFILGTPADFERFPATWFGYAYHAPERHAELTDEIAANYPNVSVINTYEISQQIEELIGLLVILTMIIVLPTLVLATLLIIALILLSYGDRRRDAARLLAIGATPRWVERLYLAESLSTTIFAFIVAYGLSLGISAGPQLRLCFRRYWHHQYNPGATGRSALYKGLCACNTRRVLLHSNWQIAIQQQI